MPNNEGPALWDFDHNIAHNNEGAGIRFWFNNSEAHLVEHTITYRNGLAGIETGAYRNSIRYRDVLVLENRDQGILHHSATTGKNQGTEDTRGAFYDRVQVYSREGPALRTGRIRLAPQGRIEWVDCVLEAGPGFPKVQVDNADNALWALFRHCGLVPDDFAFADPIPSPMEGSSIIIEHEDGRKWEITVQSGTKVVRQIN